MLTCYTIDNFSDFQLFFGGPSCYLPYYHDYAQHIAGWQNQYARNFKAIEFANRVHNHGLNDFFYNEKKAAKLKTFDMISLAFRPSIAYYPRLILDGAHRLTAYMTLNKRDRNVDLTLKNKPVVLYEIEGRMAQALFPFDTIHLS